MHSDLIETICIYIKERLNPDLEIKRNQKIMNQLPHKSTQFPRQSFQNQWVQKFFVFVHHHHMKFTYCILYKFIFQRPLYCIIYYTNMYFCQIAIHIISGRKTENEKILCLNQKGRKKLQIFMQKVADFSFYDLHVPITDFFLNYSIRISSYNFRPEQDYYVFFMFFLIINSSFF